MINDPLLPHQSDRDNRRAVNEVCGQVVGTLASCGIALFVAWLATR